MATRALLLLVVLALGACGGGSPSTTSTIAASDAPLVHIRWTGGLCAEGTCEAEQWILRDGTVVAGGEDPPPPWRVAPDRLVALLAAVDGADYARILARPFTDTCPVAYDGQEVITTFFTSAGQVRISSCEVAIDRSEAPWVQLEAALRGG